MKRKLFQYSLAVLCFFAACHVSQKAQQPMQDFFDTQGHRGSRGLMPENSVPAMLTALGLGVRTLEMDVVITKEKQVLVSHEPWFSKDITTKPDGSYIGEREERKFNIYWMTYDEIKTFDVGLKPHPRFPNQQKLKQVKPLLADLIDSVKQYMMMARRPPPHYNIEIKTIPDFDGVFHPGPEEFVDLVMKVIDEKMLTDYVSIQSFDIRPLQYLRKKYPTIKIGLLIDADDKRTIDQQVKELTFIPDTYSPSFNLVNKRLVEKAHSMKMRIVPWTVNTKEKIEDLKKMGVDGLISDYPDLF
jgi:glycerophosphoryl diester phosphodiesterase